MTDDELERIFEKAHENSGDVGRPDRYSRHIAGLRAVAAAQREKDAQTAEEYLGAKNVPVARVIRNTA